MLAGRGSGRALSSCATWALSMLSVAMSEAAEPLFDQPVCAGCALVRPKPFAMPRGPYPPPWEIQFEKSEAFRAVTQGFVSENNNRRFDAPFVVPAHQLVFCKVAKVASSGWLRLLRRMEGHADWQRNPYFLSHRHYVGGVRQMSHLSNAEALRVLRDRANWTRVVIVRDPAERLLSAYLDKIHGQRDTRAQNAIYSKVLFGLAPQEFANVTFGDFVERVEYGLAHGIVDQHWSPLADNCDLRTWLPAYDLVINMRKGDDMSKLLDCVLNTVAQRSSNRPMLAGMRDTFNQTFAAASAHATKAEQQYYTPELLRRVMGMYAEDYALFGLPRPTHLLR